jgi:hypothetical protein
MTRLFPLTAAVYFLALAAAAPGAPDDKFIFVDLGPNTNQKRADNFGSGRDGNDLKAVGKGSRTLAGMNFKLADGVIQLGSDLLGTKKPTKVEGIKVGHTCAKLYILHATGYGNGSTVGEAGKEGDPLFIADGTKIAEYKIRYDDGASAIIPVVYGEDVRDWWFTAGAKGVTRGKVAWQGDNELAKSINCRIRLYLTSWENPHPAKKISAIDYVKVGDGPAAPFCVAITLEAK